MAKRRPTDNDSSVSHPVVARALTFFKSVVKAEETQRQHELDDLTFEAGDHWHPVVKAERDAAGEPCVTIDLLSGPLNQIEGQAQESRAGITLAANKPGTAKDAAGLLQGFARNIEQQSQAIDVYQHAVRRTSRAGRGGWRILPEYEADDSFDQVLKVKWVDNWHCVYLAPAKEQDGSDRTQALIVEDLTYDQYTARFGGNDNDSLSESLGAAMQSLGDTPASWMTSDRVRVAEYMEVKMKDRVLLQIERRDPLTGQTERQTVYADQLPATKASKGAKATAILPEGWEQINSRKVTEKSCCWYFINAQEVLEEQVWAIPYIPVIEIEGERRNIDGAIDRRGLVRMGKELNRMADYHETAIIEEVDAARTAPWLYEWSQIEGFEDIWEHPKGKKGLPYRGVSADGKMIPPPQRNFGNPSIEGSVVAAQRSEQLFLKVTGTPDLFANETQHTQSNQSGRAILARQRQQEVGNSKYLVSRNRGIAYTGKILLAWMPAIYDTPRVHRGIKAVGEQKEQDIVTYCGEKQKLFAMRLAQQHQVESGNVIDIQHAAKYDVAVMTGKPYATQQQETVELITSAIQAFPPIAPKALPILFRNADGPGMQELAAALEPSEQKGIPIEEAKKAQQMIDALAEQNTQLHEEIERKGQELASKERMAQAEMETRKQIAAAQEETKRLIAQLQLDRADALAVLEGMRADADRTAAHAHDVGMEAMRAVHADGAADAAHGRSLEQLAAQPEPTGAEA